MLGHPHQVDWSFCAWMGNLQEDAASKKGVPELPPKLRKRFRIEDGPVAAFPEVGIRVTRVAVREVADDLIKVPQNAVRPGSEQRASSHGGFDASDQW